MFFFIDPPQVDDCQFRYEFSIVNFKYSRLEIVYH
nr:MAG TPA: hypothetical protein [Caudoviricetes sp.]